MKCLSLIFLSLLTIVTTVQADELTLPAYIQAQPMFPFDGPTFAQRMGVQSLNIDGSEPSFWHFTEDTKTGISRVEFATVEYACRDQVTVTLIPMVHIGEKSYYDHADQVAKAADHLLYEGMRGDYLFGPPFEQDPRIKTTEDLRSLTAFRIKTFGKMIVSFHKVMNRNPKSLSEISEGIPTQVPPGFIDRIALDAWGQPYIFKSFGDGSVTVSSTTGTHATSPLEIRVPATLPPDAVGLPPIDAVEAYSKVGQAAKLILQSSYPMTSYDLPTSKDADISFDMIGGSIPVEAKRANNNYRNLVAITSLEDLLEKQPVKKGTSIAIMYGALHMLKFHQYLTGTKLACRPTKTTWIKAIEANPNDSSLSPQMVSLRKAFVSGLKILKPTLDPDPFGVGQFP